MLLWFVLVAIYFIAGGILLAQAALHLSLMRWVKRTKPRTTQCPEFEADILVQLPVYNEEQVVVRLLDAVSRLRWKVGRVQVQILDDSTDGTSNLISAWLVEHPSPNWSHHRRPNRQGFKAGALQSGLEQADPVEFVAIFDADFLPNPDFLERAVPLLASYPQRGAIQARWAHLNSTVNALTAIQALNLDVHFTIEQGGRSTFGEIASFNGTAGVWRREAIEAAGGWQSDTLAEDFDLSLRARFAGWGVAYSDDLAAPAELPSGFGAYASQQHRWTAGGAGCARKHLRTVLQKSQGLHRWHVLGQLLSSSIHVPVWLMTTASVPLVLLGEPAWGLSWVLPTGSIFAVALLALVAMYRMSFQLRGHTDGFAARMCGMLLLSAGMTWRNVLSVKAGWQGRPGEFVRTPKGGMASAPVQMGWPVEWAWSAYFLGGVALGVHQGEWGLVPFHLLLAAGYAWVSQMSSES